MIARRADRSTELPRVQAPAVPSPNVQVRKLSPLGSRTRVVVETKDRAATFLGADPALVSELMRVAQQIAHELQSRAGGGRIRMDAPVDAKGALRIELSAPAENSEAEPSERRRREPRGE